MWLRTELVQLVGEHDRLAPLGRATRGLQVQLEQVVRQATPQRLAAERIHVQHVPGLTGGIRIPLEHLAGVPVLAQTLGERESAQTGTGDKDVQRALGHGYPCVVS